LLDIAKSCVFEKGFGVKHDFLPSALAENMLFAIGGTRKQS
jgi:hypothetical protein